MKARNIILILAAVMFLVGSVLGLVAMSLVGFKMEKLSSMPERIAMTYVYDITENTKIVLNDRDKNVRVKESEDDKLRIKCFESEKEKYLIEKTDNEINIGFSSQLSWYNYIGINIKTTGGYIELYIPEKFSKHLEIKTVNGEIEVKNMTFIDDVTLNSTNGKIEIEDNDFGGNLKVKTTNASVDLKDLNVKKEIEIKTSNGNIHAENVASDEDIELATTNSDIKTTDVSAMEDLTAETTNGEVKAEKTKATSISLITSNDTIEVSEIDASESITLKTRNGDIEGSIIGAMADFSITSGTRNGNNNLPESADNGVKELTAETSNSDIEIKFVILSPN